MHNIKIMKLYTCIYSVYFKHQERCRGDEKEVFQPKVKRYYNLLFFTNKSIVFENKTTNFQCLSAGEK